MSTIIVIPVEHTLDLITNSSSELFVLKGQSKKLVEKLISTVYPDYLKEYEDLLTTKDLTEDQLDSYISYHYSFWSNEDQREIINLVPGFTFDEMYVKGRDDWRGKPTYHIRDTFVSDNVEKIKESIDPKNNMFYLFSIDENPDWDMQEKLSNIGQRYHLG